MELLYVLRCLNDCNEGQVHYNEYNQDPEIPNSNNSSEQRAYEQNNNQNVGHNELEVLLELSIEVFELPGCNRLAEHFNKESVDDYELAYQTAEVV